MSGVLDQTDFVVKRRPQLMEVRAGYDVYDQLTMSTLAQIEQDESLAAPEVRYLVDFIRTSQRGVILRRATRRAEELVADE